jgi:DNA-binding transcriptional LysR family regulator
MELTEIRTFVAVGESGSVSRAAEILRVSQPAVTRRIQRLETALGILLLDRHARPPALTRSGKQLLEPCRIVLKAVDDVRTAAAPAPSLTGEFRLGIVSSLADLALPRLTNQLRRTFPRLTVRFKIGLDRGPLGAHAEGDARHRDRISPTRRLGPSQDNRPEDHHHLASIRRASNAPSGAHRGSARHLEGTVGAQSPRLCISRGRDADAR